MAESIGLFVARRGTTGPTAFARMAQSLIGNMQIGPIRRVVNSMQYRVIYEKISPLGPLGGDGQSECWTIEAKDIVEATSRATEMVNENERVKSIEGPA